MDKVYIIDASPIFYKAFFAIPALNSKNGIQTNAAYGYTKTLLKLIKKYNPEYLAVCFDHRSNFRKEMYEDYKRERKPMASNLSAQVPIIKTITETMGITIVEKEGYEADDLIGMLVKIAEKEGKEVVIVSPDKDLCQLVSDQTKVLLDITKEQFYNAEKVTEKFGIPPKYIVDFLGLSGDTVDGIPGVLGIGKGSAIKLINEFGSIEDIYKNLDKVNPGVKKKLEAGLVLAEMSKKLATIITDSKECPIKNIDQIKKGFIDKIRLANLFDALNFLSLKDKIQDIE